MGRNTPMAITTRKVEMTEEKVMENILNEIGGSDDPVDQYKAIERYDKFVEARSKRLRSETTKE
jgi:hypothetical protein